MPRIEINLNDDVKVKLTKEGLAQWRCFLNGLGIKPPTLTTDSEGLVEFQLWELFNIFGSQTYNGNENKMFFDNVIVIEKE